MGWVDAFPSFAGCRGSLVPEAIRIGTKWIRTHWVEWIPRGDIQYTFSAFSRGWRRMNGGIKPS